MRMTRVVVFAALVLGACSNSQDGDPTEPAATLDVQAGETFRLRPGGIARVGSSGLLVGFRGITEDSRCPIDVVCVWEGDAVARVRATASHTDDGTAFDLHTTLEPKAVEFAGRRITLVAVEPAARAGQPIDADAYVITLRVD